MAGIKRRYPVAPVVAVGAVILRDEEVLLVQRGQEPSIGIWTVPGGVVELGEETRSAVQREVAEETGLVVSVGPVVAVMDHVEHDGDGIRYHYVILDFLATLRGGTLSPSADAADARWVPLSSLHEYRVTEKLLGVIRRAREIVAVGGFLLQS